MPFPPCLHPDSKAIPSPSIAAKCLSVSHLADPLPLLKSFIGHVLKREALKRVDLIECSFFFFIFFLIIYNSN